MTIDRRQIALDAVAPFRKRPLGHFIDGRDLPGSGAPFEVTEPATGQVIGQALDATPAEVDAAVAAAKGAFPAWAATPGAERRKILHRIADLIEARADEIAA
ncbi:MAG TPA: aldehyde dehydrogenase family protein, partial [Caulobacteraceae bacterium]|nr:aldehyde dehydrogenase family protein [Caulobacteraceae bacterium]